MVTRAIVSAHCNSTIMIFIYSKAFKILLFTFITGQPKHVQQNIKFFVARLGANAVRIRTEN